MKFSGSLLHDKVIGERIFNSSLDKTKNLLTDVFGLNFNNTDPSITSLIEDPESYSFKVVFNFNAREITASFNFEKDKEDVYTEVLRIHEFEIEYLPISESKDEFKERVKKIQDLLESKYDINFTPLDPDDKDTNIIDVNIDNQEQTWEAVFTVDYHEADFKVTYKYEPGLKEPKAKVFTHKQHTIYLD